MRHLALAIAAVFMLALVAPAFAQPFADVPADHWAFDAIAELAAKGILEGFPDGTFKGDRAMTRYEMAMALARILARIEAIKIPPPPKIPPPEVRRADIDRLQRLINEFRAELSALGVRITAVEEQLAAVKARLAQDTTRITGNWNYFYWVPGSTNPDYGPYPELSRNRLRLIVRGQVTGDMVVTARLRWNSTFNANLYGFSGGLTGTTDFDRLIGTWASPWGLTFAVGRDYWALGPQGILLQLQSSREGARVVGTFGGITLTGIAFFSVSSSVVVPPAPPTAATNASATTYAARAEFAPVSGWTFGVNYRSDRESTGLFTGFTLGNTGSGWSVDVAGDLMPGVSLLAEYAAYTPTGGCVAVGGCNALFAALTLDLGAIGGMSTFSPSLEVYYKDYDAGWFERCGNTFCTNTYSGHWAFVLGFDMSNVTAWGADLTLQVSPRLSVVLGYESGTWNGDSIAGLSVFLAGDTYTSFGARADYSLSRNATASLEYFNLNNTTVAVNNNGSSGYVFRVTFSW